MQEASKPIFFYDLSDDLELELSPIDEDSDNVKVFLKYKKNESEKKNYGIMSSQKIAYFISNFIDQNSDIIIPLSKKLRIKLMTIDPLLTISNKEVFKNYLITMHFIMRSSVPLMQTAYEICKKNKTSELIRKTTKYFCDHIQEELNHDEWLIDDLETIGISRQHVMTLKPPNVVAELVGSQYYWIYHFHPICLLGYIAFLEGNPPEKETVDELKNITGYPETAFRTIAKHSYLDPNHRNDMNLLLDSLPLTIQQQEWIISNAVYSANKFNQIFCND
jgi:hypothetical protein